MRRGYRLGTYEIQELLGKGGMGDVYRARDTNLGRDVAIKLLPPHLGADPGRLARLRREARSLASLNHPGVATIFGFEEQAGIHFIVMELVEGLTLAETLRAGPLPVSHAVRVAEPIARAVAAAHARGIVHRDLKPANIKVTPHGMVKVLDFGLAKAVTPTSGDAVTASVAAAGTAVTSAGVVLGSAPYMSPEQARGLGVDARTDVWAFGCVLYELLTGRRAFPGQTASDAVVAVLERDPDWALLPAVPPLLAQLLRWCLRKDPDQRLHSMADVRLVLETLARGEDWRAGEFPVASPRRRRHTVGWLAALAMVVAAVIFASVRGVDERTARRGIRFRYHPIEGVGSAGATSNSLAVAPDGSRIVYTDANEGALRIRRIDELESRILSETQAAKNPFWSPDGQSLGFTTGASLRRIDLNGAGPPRTIVKLDSGDFLGPPSWGRDDTILYALQPPAPSGIFRISVEGNAPLPVTRPEQTPGRRFHGFPQYLPDGRRFLFVALGRDRSSFWRRSTMAACGPWRT